MLRKFSLKTNFLLTALVAICISHAFASWRLYHVQLRETWLEDHRNKSWPDPSKINVISLAAPATAYTIIPIDWKWRVMLPDNVAYTLHVDFGEGLSRSLDSPRADGSLKSLTAPLPSGTMLLSVTVSPTADNAVHVLADCDGTTTEVTLEDSLGIFEPENGFLTTKIFFNHTLGISQTVSEPTQNPLLLAFREAMNATNGHNATIRIWIEPQPVKLTELSNAPQSPSPLERANPSDPATR